MKIVYLIMEEGEEKEVGLIGLKKNFQKKVF
jgi:hypothetical protein